MQSFIPSVTDKTPNLQTIRFSDGTTLSSGKYVDDFHVRKKLRTVDRAFFDKDVIVKGDLFVEGLLSLNTLSLDDLKTETITNDKDGGSIVFQIKNVSNVLRPVFSFLTSTNSSQQPLSFGASNGIFRRIDHCSTLNLRDEDYDPSAVGATETNTAFLSFKNGVITLCNNTNAKNIIFQNKNAGNILQNVLVLNTSDVTINIPTILFHTLDLNSDTAINRRITASRYRFYDENETNLTTRGSIHSTGTQFHYYANSTSSSHVFQVNNSTPVQVTPLTISSNNLTVTVPIDLNSTTSGNRNFNAGRINLYDTNVSAPTIRSFIDCTNNEMNIETLETPSLTANQGQFNFFRKDSTGVRYVHMRMFGMARVDCATDINTVVFVRPTLWTQRSSYEGRSRFMYNPGATSQIDLCDFRDEASAKGILFIPNCIAGGYNGIVSAGDSVITGRQNTSGGPPALSNNLVLTQWVANDIGNHGGRPILGIKLSTTRTQTVSNVNTTVGSIQIRCGTQNITFTNTIVRTINNIEPEYGFDSSNTTSTVVSGQVTFQNTIAQSEGNAALISQTPSFATLSSINALKRTNFQLTSASATTSNAGSGGTANPVVEMFDISQVNGATKGFMFLPNSSNQSWNPLIGANDSVISTRDGVYNNSPGLSTGLTMTVPTNIALGIRLLHRAYADSSSSVPNTESNLFLTSGNAQMTITHRVSTSSNFSIFDFNPSIRLIASNGIDREIRNLSAIRWLDNKNGSSGGTSTAIITYDTTSTTYNGLAAFGMNYMLNDGNNPRHRFFCNDTDGTLRMPFQIGHSNIIIASPIYCNYVTDENGAVVNGPSSIQHIGFQKQIALSIYSIANLDTPQNAGSFTLEKGSWIVHLQITFSQSFDRIYTELLFGISTSSTTFATTFPWNMSNRNWNDFRMDGSTNIKDSNCSVTLTTDTTLYVLLQVVDDSATTSTVTPRITCMRVG